jgi:hypothetical protein
MVAVKLGRVNFVCVFDLLLDTAVEFVELGDKDTLIAQAHTIG